MAEFEEKLDAILNDPQAMGQIMALAQSLGGTGDRQAAPLPSRDPSQEADYEPVDGPSPAGLNLNPRLVEVGMKALSAYQDTDNKKAALLQALRPFVKEERAGKLDKAVEITRISKAIRAVLDGLKGGEEGV